MGTMMTNKRIDSKEIEKGRNMKTDIFVRYDTPEQYAEAFQQMIDAREKWREKIRRQENDDKNRKITYFDNKRRNYKKI